MLLNPSAVTSLTYVPQRKLKSTDFSFLPLTMPLYPFSVLLTSLGDGQVFFCSGKSKYMSYLPSPRMSSVHERVFKLHRRTSHQGIFNGRTEISDGKGVHINLIFDGRTEIRLYIFFSDW